MALDIVEKGYCSLVLSTKYEVLNAHVIGIRCRIAGTDRFTVIDCESATVTDDYVLMYFKEPLDRYFMKTVVQVVYV